MPLSCSSDSICSPVEWSGREDEARSYYWTVAHLGERVQLGGATEIQRLIAAGLRAKAYEHLLGPLWFSLNSHFGGSNSAALRNPLLA